MENRFSLIQYLITIMHKSKETTKIQISNVLMLLIIIALNCDGFTRRNKIEVLDLKTYKNSIGMEFVLIPAGEFEMGCTLEYTTCRPNEKDPHTVQLKEPFYLGKFEVTQGQWKKIMGENPSFHQGEDCPEGKENSDSSCDEYPVESVSWNEVQKFIEKLNELDTAGRQEKVNPSLSSTDIKYRLPTEAEWEYAARGGMDIPYPNGDILNDEDGWYKLNSNRTIHKVGQKKPNRFGLYDMAGNVWEWVNDKYEGPYGNGESSLTTTPQINTDDRILRGGSFGFDFYALTVSYREPGNSGAGFHSYGFRLVLPFKEEKKTIPINSDEKQIILPGSNWNPPLLKTGQNKSNFDGDDGFYQKGKDKSYTDNGDGTVVDNTTGITWQKCNMGQEGKNCETGNSESTQWEKAIEYCNNLNLAKRKWRLPLQKELLTLVEYGINNPAFAIAGFLNTDFSYWSANTYAGDTNKAWRINFSDGDSGSNFKQNSYYVRCVSKR